MAMAIMFWVGKPWKTMENHPNLPNLPSLGFMSMFGLRTMRIIRALGGVGMDLDHFFFGTYRARLRENSHISRVSFGAQDDRC